MRLVLRLLLLLAASCFGQNLFGQNLRDLEVFLRPFSAITAPTGSATLTNNGQLAHLLMVRFPAAAADVTPIQVRIEASYDGLNFFPVSADITTARFIAGFGAYAIQRANGAFPAVRINSLLATPGAAPMDAFYTGSPVPYGDVFFTGDRFLWGPPGGFYDKATFVVCNGAPCTVGANLTNEYIVASSLTFRTCFAFAKTAPTGADLIFDINRNGSSIWTAGQRLRIPAGASTVQQVSAFTVPNVNQIDRLTIDIDQIGSVVAGQDVTITCLLDPA